MRRAPFVAALLAALTLLAAPAGAATVRTVVPPGEACDRSGCAPHAPVTHVEAGPGEVNRIALTLEGGRLVVRDGGAPLAAGESCVAVDEHTASCVVGDSARVVTGDGDDVVTSAIVAAAVLGDGDDRFAGPGSADGGPGDDELRGGGEGSTLTGGDGDDVLVGGDGTDGLLGGAGRDELRGGGGDDRLDPTDAPAAPAPDTVDGGPGRDLVDYSASDPAAGVVVDLAAGGPAGAPGEGDVVLAAEDVRGTPGVDRLIGDDGPNALDAQGGTDVLDGRGGDDTLWGPLAPARATILGGAGDDRVVALGGARVLDGGAGDDVVTAPADEAPVRCGPGADVVSELSGSATPALVDCEQYRFDVGDLEWTASLFLPRAPHRERLRVRVTCPRQAPTCRAGVTVTARGATRASAPRWIAPGRAAAFAVPLSRAAARAASRPGGTSVRIAVRFDPRGPIEPRTIRVPVWIGAGA